MSKQRGFIALMSAIVISVLLLAITLSLGFSGFFTRFNILDSESKERSSALAEACGDTAILNLAQGLTTLGSVVVGAGSCNIISFTPNIKTQACVNKAVTNLEITVDSSFNILSWQEVPNFSPNIPATCP